MLYKHEKDRIIVERLLKLKQQHYFYGGRILISQRVEPFLHNLNPSKN